MPDLRVAEINMVLVFVWTLLYRGTMQFEDGTVTDGKDASSVAAERRRRRRRMMSQFHYGL